MAHPPPAAHKRLRLFVQPFQERPTEHVDIDGTEHQLLEQTAEEKFLQVVKKIDFSKKRDRHDASAGAASDKADVQEHPWVPALNWLNAAQKEMDALFHMLTSLESGQLLTSARVPRSHPSGPLAHRVLAARVAHKRRALLDASDRLAAAAAAGRRHAAEDLGLVLDVARLARKWPLRLTRPPLRSLRIAPHDSPVERVPPAAPRTVAAAAVSLPAGSLEPLLCPGPMPHAPPAVMGQVQAVGHRQIDALLRRAHWTLFSGAVLQALQDEAAAGGEAQVVRGLVALPAASPARSALVLGAPTMPAIPSLLLLAGHLSRPAPRHTLAQLHALRMHDNALTQLRSSAHALAAALPLLAFRVVRRSAQPRLAVTEFVLLEQVLATVEVRDGLISVRGTATERLSVSQVLLHVSCEASRVLEHQLLAQTSSLQIGASVVDGTLSFSLSSAGPRDVTAALSVRFSAAQDGCGVDVQLEWEQRADGLRQRRRCSVRELLQLSTLGSRSHVPSLLVALEALVLRPELSSL